MRQHRLKQYMAIGLMMVIGATMLTGCSKTVPFLQGNDAEQVKTITSNEIKIPVNRINSFNPVNSKEESVYYINRLIYEGLFALDETLTAVPVLAESYVVDKENASVTITLKSGVQWHDGSAFGATDVKYSVDAYLGAAYEGTSLYSNGIGKIKSTKVRGNNSITIYFKSPKDMAIENLTFPILPSGQYKRAENLRRATADFTPIGTGPYRVANLDKVKEITLEGFAGYHGTVPTNRIIFKIMPDPTTSSKLFAINDLSISFAKESNRESYADSKGVQLNSFPSNEMELVGYNVNRPGINDKKVRKALAWAIDSEEIMDTGYFKNGVLNDSLYYPGYMGVKSDQKRIGYDLNKAKKMLEEAGYGDMDGNGFVENGQGEELSISILINSDNPSRKIAATTIKESLEKLLIHVTVDEREWNSYNSAIVSGNYDLFIGGYRIQDTYDLRFLLHSDYQNPAGYANLTLNFLLDQLQSGISGQERLETYQSVDKIIDEDLPYYCMFYKTYGILQADSLKGDVKATFWNLYNGCENWYTEYTEKIRKAGQE